MKRCAAVLVLCLFCVSAWAQVRGLSNFSELAEKQGLAVVNVSPSEISTFVTIKGS